MNYQSSSDTTAMMRMQEVSGTMLKADEPVTVKINLTCSQLMGYQVLTHINNMHVIATTFIA